MFQRLIPIFPLPDVVLFPNVFLPLHIFEPRYRAMVAEALEGDRMIGMVLLKPGWEDDYLGAPPVYPVGCNGLITHAERLTDGRYNIILRGLEKFRIVEEEPGASYRRARVEVLHEATIDAERDRLHSHRQRLEALVTPSTEHAGLDQTIPTTMPDEDSDPCPRPVPVARAPRTPGAARAGRRVRPLRVADRTAGNEGTDGQARLEALAAALTRDLSSQTPRRRASTSTIRSPWKRPFSMKTAPVSSPATAPPATKTFGWFVSIVSGL